MKKWRLLDTGVRTAAANMALDEAILEARGRGLAPDTLRFLQFSPPAVLVGYHQSVEQEVRGDFCRGSGIDINRRLTGGGAIFFDESQLGWEITAGAELLAEGRARLFARLAQGAVASLRRLGVAASFRPRNDIEVGGRKISGTGGAEGDGAFLFQGTLLVNLDVDTMLRALRVPVEKLVDKEVRSLRERVTWLKRELGYQPPLAQIKAALRAGFEEVLGVSLVEDGLTTEEERLFEEKLSFFTSAEWIYQMSYPQSQQVLRSLYKAPGGLIRVALIIEGGLIKTAIITGDFFAYPRRVILDLEAALKDAPAIASAIDRIVEGFFGQGKAFVESGEQARSLSSSKGTGGLRQAQATPSFNTPSTPGIAAADFARAIKEALERGQYGGFGITPEEANGIFTVGKPLAELPRSSVLLLPYCAKLVDCPLRHQDDCTQCGLCSVGEAYRLAEEKGLRPISIMNYEHLQETLAQLREQGVKGYIGTCCQAFYAKHRSDFEAAGLPGVLVDIDNTTCYDLGEESLAYRGAFERQTHLRLELLSKVMAAVGGEG